MPPTSSVVPPGGSTGGIVKPGGSSVGGVKPLGLVIGNDGRCAVGIDANLWLGLAPSKNECTPADLESANKLRDLEAQAATGNVKAKIEIQKIEAIKLAGLACGKQGTSVINCQNYVERVAKSDILTKDFSPAQQLQFWQSINRGLSEGLIGNEELKQFAAFASSCRASGLPLST